MYAAYGAYLTNSFWSLKQCVILINSKVPKRSQEVGCNLQSHCFSSEPSAHSGKPLQRKVLLMQLLSVHMCSSVAQGLHSSGRSSHPLAQSLSPSHRYSALRHVGSFGHITWSCWQVSSTECLLVQFCKQWAIKSDCSLQAYIHCK